MNEVIAPAPPEFKDRRIGLLIFGIIIILLGFGLILMDLLLSVSMLLPRAVDATPPPPLRFMMPTLLLYLGLAIGFIWLGIGSILKRRWARALIFVSSCAWLASGIGGMGTAAYTCSKIFAKAIPGRPEIPPEVQMILLVTTLVVESIMYIVIPAILVFFYRSPHVKATCEKYDPVKRWTDNCPLPVLALSILLGLGAIALPLMTMMNNSVTPFFGTYISGAVGTVALSVLAAAYGYSAYACYKLKPLGWWIAFTSLVLGATSYTITIARCGLLPMYELMDLPQSTLEQIKSAGLTQGPLMWLMLVGFTLPYVAFILYCKRYFKK